ncbi:hypothetical protein ABZ153_16880 [Streptomyces sp. NPDC006290]|uniref:hypothetical protein n=1 Tax=Streptomyces sp. NPDC006290 TaxID=3156745 RepID=UPI0033A9AB01
MCEDFEAEPAEFNGENNHVYLLLNLPPEVVPSKPADSLKGRQLPPGCARSSPTSLATTTGPTNLVGLPLRRIRRRGSAVVRQYIKQQTRRL